jgi:hypothetical protein
MLRADSIRSNSGTFTDNILLTKYLIMKTIRNYVLFACTVTLLSGCIYLSYLTGAEQNTVTMEYDWWNNLLNVPVISGALRNSGYADVSTTIIEVTTFNSLGECLHKAYIEICETIPSGSCIPFKERIYGSREAHSLTARVVEYH